MTARGYRFTPQRLAAIVVASICALMAAPSVWSQTPVGTFGFRKGMTRAELEKLSGPLQEEQPGVFTARRVPSPDAGFKRYGLVITPKTGLCGLLAGGYPIDVNGAGTEIQAAFASMRARLSREYGATPRTIDRLGPGSGLTRPGDWSKALYKNERVLSALWRLGPNPSGLRLVELTAGGLSESKALLWLNYTFDVPGGCVNELKELRRASLTGTK